MSGAAALGRELVEQTRVYVKEHVNGHRQWSTERRISRRLSLPALPRRPGKRQVWAVTMVRDEIDVIGLSIDHLLRQGVDHILVSDHLSEDGTREFLMDLAGNDGRVHVALDSEPGHFQMEKMSRLARAAWWAGAEWVIPFDADEFWFAPGESLSGFLAGHKATVVTAHTVKLLPALPGPAARQSAFLLDPSGRGDPKVAFRAHPLALIGPGNHGVARAGEQAAGLVVAHLPFRGPAQIRRKFRTGAAALDCAGAPDYEGWHWRSGARLSDEALNAVWQRMQAGDALPEIAWPGVDPSRHERVLEWETWPVPWP